MESSSFSANQPQRHSRAKESVLKRFIHQTTLMSHFVSYIWRGEDLFIENKNFSLHFVSSVKPLSKIPVMRRIGLFISYLDSIVTLFSTFTIYNIFREELQTSERLCETSNPQAGSLRTSLYTITKLQVVFLWVLSLLNTDCKDLGRSSFQLRLCGFFLQTSTFD